MRPAVLLSALLLAPVAACGGGEPVASAACSTGHCQSLTFITSTMGFAKHVPNGDPRVVAGFDVDNHVTVEEAIGCYQEDQIDPEGRVGIDNNSASLFEAIAGLTDDALEGLIQMSINQGALLLVLRFEGVDDLRNDPEITAQVFKGTGVPQLGTDNLIAPNQTFEIDTSLPSTQGGGRIVDGVIEAGPFDAVVPINIFEVQAQLRLHSARVRGRLTEDGRLEDVLVGGGVEIAQIYEIAEVAGANDHNARSILGLLPFVLDPSADLAPNADGTCEQISAALTITTQPGFLLNDPFRLPTYP